MDDPPARYLRASVTSDALASRKMAFISGPRQVGKTTLAKSLLAADDSYFTWDETKFRISWARSPASAIASRGPGPIVLDEIHKDRRWKQRLKGLYDVDGGRTPIIVTGSARHDVYRRGGDSLLGRYLPYRLHPLSVGERAAPPAPADALGRIGDVAAVHRFADLLELGGFPEPLLAASVQRAARWSRLRVDRILNEDVRDLRNVGDGEALRVMVELLPERVGSLLSLNALREDVGIAFGTAKAWLSVLESLYYAFTIRPFTGRVARSLRAEPKLYLYDVLQIPREAAGARLENLTALHLLKACHYWTDTAEGAFELRFLRDKEKREVDFVVLRDRKPWLLVECKSNETDPAPALLHWMKHFPGVPAFQLTTKPHHRSFPGHGGLRVVSYEKFLAALV